MDNQTRSENTRKKAIEAALSILTREGVGGLTFDSLSRESGISKGGLLHQFRTKDGVLKALLDHQRQQFERIGHEHMAKAGAAKTEPCLSSQIAIYRESVKQPHSVARAVLAALVENPELLAEMKATDVERMKKMREESSDLELSLLRYFAASGLAFNALLGMSHLPESMMNRLFDRLLDEASWVNQKPAAKKTRKKVAT
ncbi:TetR/AcrR family transcriptional regulator [Paraburkholderia sp. Tr-20389]|uniref:TetR/AcrR family transcriptional regulator n=1 Tax=Paraburkholderia sp. Tr-20389 TaxID=2703903 RepID=UPI00197E86C6|nr:TetR/AcrR family transcriptional regulator [Paraburkholderia sp. Tr-20389]MBN3757659.1 TetR/AcrR family transcriptional regulator [Paraburkholderia sp. Tr-20389]